MNPFSGTRAISVLVMIIGIFFSFYIGRVTGQTDTRMLTIIFGSFFVIGMCLWLRTLIWLLIPFCWGLTGRISVLPLPFSVRDLGVGLVAVMFCVFFALKMVRFKSISGWLEGLVMLNLAYIGVMFLRHPVGTEAMASEMVGGRPYFNVIVALIAFGLLRMVIIPPALAKVFPFFMLAGSLLVAGLGTLTRVFPSLVPIIAPLYNGITIDTYLQEQGLQESVAGTRRTELAGPGSTVIQVLCSYFKPITLILPAYPIRMILFALGGVGILYAGFRNVILGSSIFFLTVSYFQGGGRDLFRSLALGFVVLIAMIAIQLSIGLPLQAQRALSFIPFVPWDAVEKADAEGSTTWRLEMWSMVWNDKRYLKDKIWGDGFGFSGYELKIMRAGDMGGTGIIGGAAQENFMINGALHSGPLSSIRFAGVVGLILFMVLSIYIAVMAPLMIKSAKGTPFFPATLFICVPLVTSPLFFVFIFGAYDAGVPDTFFTAGLVRLLQNSILEYKKTLPPPEEVVLPKQLLHVQRSSPIRKKAPSLT